MLADPALAGRVDDPGTGTVRFVAMPARVAPFADVHCRRAVQYAVDKAAVKDALGGTYAASLATTLWPRGLPGYPATAPYPAGEGNRGDLAAARTELARCSRPAGFATTLGTVNDGRGKVAADAVARALARVGIQVTVKEYPRGVVPVRGGRLAGGASATDGLGLVVAEWAADFPSPYAFLVPLADGRSIRPAANPNVAELGGERAGAGDRRGRGDPGPGAGDGGLAGRGGGRDEVGRVRPAGRGPGGAHRQPPAAQRLRAPRLPRLRRGLARRRVDFSGYPIRPHPLGRAPSRR